MNAVAQLDRLLAWVVDHAYPLWWRVGADHVLGGFHEKIGQDGQPVILPKRGRVLPRQIYAFSQADRLGWRGDAAAAVRHGVDFYLAHFLRPDGLVRALVAPDGTKLQEGPAFYDQAFGLLGLHSAYAALGHDRRYRDLARALIATWTAGFKHPERGFEEASPRQLPLCSNPHMHMLESCLAWAESDGDGPWRAIADEIAHLALDRFIDRDSGILREFFAGDWSPMADQSGHLFEPGHQFEWAWLLLRWGGMAGEPRAAAAAMRLIALAEKYGVDPARGVACNVLTDDFRRQDWRARLWPQTERIKAHCLAAEITGKAEHWRLADQAADGLMLYFATPVAGLWFDMLGEQDGMLSEPAPASSFYHIVCAIVEYQRAVGAAR